MSPQSPGSRANLGAGAGRPGTSQGSPTGGGRPGTSHGSAGASGSMNAIGSERPPTSMTGTMATIAEPATPRLRSRVASWLLGALVQNAGIKLVALILAVTLFILVNTDEDREIGATVRVAYMLPENKVLMSDRVDTVRVTVRGPWRRVKRFDEREIPPINVDLRTADGGELAFTKEMVQLPEGLALVSISPSLMPVAFEPRVDKEVEVRPAVVGRPLYGYRFIDAQATPAKVRVRGPASEVAAIEGVRTREVRMDGRGGTFDEMVEVVVSEPHVEVVPAGDVQVHVLIEAEKVTERLGPLAVQARLGAGAELAAKVALEPETVTVTLHGDRLVLEAMIQRGVVPVVRVYPDDLAAGRPIRKAVEIPELPEDVSVAVRPREVTVHGKR